MSRREVLIVDLAEAAGDELAAKLEGGTFQAHFVRDGAQRRLKLYVVEIRPPEPDLRCPAIVHGERCGSKAGHSGKHGWCGGD